MKLTQFRKLIREEVRRVVNEEQQLEESVGEIALGVAGGLAGLWALVNGVPLVLSALGMVASNIAGSMLEKAKKAAAIAKREGRLETIKPIMAKFANDETLKNMYKALPEYSRSITSKGQIQNAERAKQMQAIAKYVKAKLSPEEMKFFEDISSMLRTGDLK